MQNVVEYIVKALVTDVDAVKVTTSTEGEFVVISVEVAKEDKGKVIGKGGETAESIRTIVRYCKNRDNDNKKYKVTIKD